MLAGDLDAYPFAWYGPVPDLMGQERSGRPDRAQDPTGHHEWFERHALDDMRVLQCGTAAYWAQRARDLAPEQLATVVNRASTAQLIAMGVEGWLRRLVFARDPEKLHWGLADRTLKGEPEERTAGVRDALSRALCDALGELAAKVLPVFLVPDQEIESAAEGAAEACLAWLERHALPADVDAVRGHFGTRLEAYKAAVVGPIAFALVPVDANNNLGNQPADTWWIAPGESLVLSVDAAMVPPVQPGKPADDERWGAPGGVELWLLWLPKCSEGKDSLVVRAVAKVALARVRAEVAANVAAAAAVVELRLKSRPAVPVATTNAAFIPAFTGTRIQGEFPGTEDPTIRDTAGRSVGVVAAGADVAKVLAGLEKWASSIIPHRVLRELLVRSHGADAAGARDPRRVLFDGWSGLAEAIGAPQKGDTLKTLDEVLAAGAGVRWALPNMEGAGLWTYSVTRPAPGRPSELAVILGDALMPGYAASLKRVGGVADTAQRRALRRLVPELIQEPPMDGLRDRDHGRAYTLARLAVLDFTKDSHVAAERDAVPIADARWDELAKIAGMNLATAKALREGPWVDGGAKLPPLLRRDGDGWALSRDHDPQWAFIVEGGKKRLAAQRAGKRGGRGRGNG